MSSAGWIILTGALVAGACGLPGCFLVLRRLAMLGDAISHAILPGIVVAFMLTGNRDSLPMFLGAVVLGLLTTFLVQTLSRGGVQGDAAIGVTFTALFALGVVMVSRSVGKVDLDLDCVLYGEIAYAPFDMVRGWGLAVPRPVLVNGGLLLLNLAVITAFYKQFKLCAFDPEMASAVGIPVLGMHYLLMGLVSITTVGAFESVGSILVVAMLIVPAATAYLLTDRLSTMMALSVGLGVISSAGGYLVATRLDCSIAGAISTVAGGLFTLAFLFSPLHGVVTKRVAQSRLRRRVADEDVLLWAGRRQEVESAAPAFTVRELSQAQEWLPSEAAVTVRRLVRERLLRDGEGTYQLTQEGATRALDLLRRHRIYESYLDDLGYPTDHLHAAADRVEHHLSPAVTAALNVATDNPRLDPQGKPIPPA
jgi:manganese/zinc/iron transport system permease protein